MKPINPTPDIELRELKFGGYIWKPYQFKAVDLGGGKIRIVIDMEVKK